jgi:cell wall-associated NlpC family hydrolase
MISQPACIVRSVIVVVVMASGSVACSSNQPFRSVPGSQSDSVVIQSDGVIGERAAAVALNQVGVPYRYGGSSPSGFDCSGLVHYSYANAGKTVPRTTAGLWADLAPVETRDMRTGDLLFFRIAGKMSHVGMYLGGGRFVHAPSTGRVVTVERLGSDYYRKAFIRAGRPR